MVTGTAGIPEPEIWGNSVTAVLPANWRKMKRSTATAARIRFASERILEERRRAFQLVEKCVDKIGGNSAGDESERRRCEEESEEGCGREDSAQTLHATAAAGSGSWGVVGMVIVIMVFIMIVFRIILTIIIYIKVFMIILTIIIYIKVFRIILISKVLRIILIIIVILIIIRTRVRDATILLFIRREVIRVCPSLVLPLSFLFLFLTTLTIIIIIIIIIIILTSILPPLPSQQHTIPITTLLPRGYLQHLLQRPLVARKPVPLAETPTFPLVSKHRHHVQFQPEFFHRCR